MFSRIKSFFQSPDFLKALISTFGMVLPIVIGVQLGKTDYFLSLATGVLFTAGCDVPGRRKHKTIGILIATIVAVVANMGIGLASVHLYILLPVLALLVFGIAYISVYGFRASLISFSGLLAIVLSFAHQQSGPDIVIHGLMIGAGGLWYLFLSVLFHSVLQKRHIVNMLSECLSLTGNYMRTRAELAISSGPDKNLSDQLLDLQVKINTLHESLRELLLQERQASGTSNYKRNQLLIFVELVDILELSLANSANYQRLHQFPVKSQKGLAAIVNLAFHLSDRLVQISAQMKGNSNMLPPEDLRPLISSAREILGADAETSMDTSKAESMILLNNLLDYVEKQDQKILFIEKIFADLNENRNTTIQKGEGKLFITRQDYDLNLLKENFSARSPIFRHAFRLTTSMLIGFGIGMIFSLQNAYWILLTIMVIMRPGYTLTKVRSKQRLVGTLIGALVAAVIVMLTQNVYVFGILSVLSLIFALAFIQKNYRLSSVFITTSVVFVYALITPNAFEVIGYRILDTLTGAVISMGAIAFLWPVWESANIKTVIIQALSANRKYLAEIKKCFVESCPPSLTYKLARKDAFLEMGNLNAAFQRMSQEPKSRQGDFIHVYEITGLNQTFLSATAALGTRVRAMEAHRVKAFATMLEKIDTNLQRTLSVLQSTENFAGNDGYLDQEIGKEQSPFDPDINEYQLIHSQLRWLEQISENIHKTIQKSNFSG